MFDRLKRYLVSIVPIKVQAKAVECLKMLDMQDPVGDTGDCCLLSEQ